MCQPVCVEEGRVRSVGGEGCPVGVYMGPSMCQSVPLGKLEPSVALTVPPTSPPG